MPEAKLDPFLLKLRIDYPGHAEEMQLVRQVTAGQIGDRLNVDAVERVIEPAGVLLLQRAAAGLTFDESVQDYAVRIVRMTRTWSGVAAGAGPRGGIALVRAARAAALIAGRDFVTPDDVKAMVLPALRHRITPSPELEIEGHNADRILQALLEKVDAPRK